MINRAIMDIEIRDLRSLEAAAKSFVKAIGHAKVYAFYGAMGAGKTTFIKAVCHELGVEDVVTSPTFAIINEYTSLKTGAPVYHFDFYRVKNMEEACDMGIDEYFNSGCLCFIEWPEVIESLLPADAVKLSIKEEPGGGRRVTSI